MTPTERELVRRQVVASRRRQGRTDSVEDADLLDRLAARLLADIRPQHDGGPGSRPGRRLTTPPSHATKGPVHHATVP
jgi:hypothetical protein